MRRITKVTIQEAGGKATSVTTLILSIPDKLARRLTMLARADGTPASKLAVEAIETFVANMDPFRRAAKKGGKHESKDWQGWNA